MKFVEYLKWCVRGKEYYEVAFPASLVIFLASLPFTIAFFSAAGVLLSLGILVAFLITIPVQLTVAGIIKSWKKFCKEKEDEKDEVVRRLQGENALEDDNYYWKFAKNKNII